MEEIMSSNTEEKQDEQCTDNSPVDLIEMVRAKHEDSRVKTENISDVLVMQIILCVLLLIIITISNILFPEFTDDFAARFRRMTSGDTEEFFKDAVSKVINIING